MAGFPPQSPDVLYLAEGGQETEVMYRHGHDLPEFALFALLDRPDGLAALQDMYARYVATAVAHGFVPLMAGLDYRLSPDWVAKVGRDPGEIPELEHRCIQFLRDVVAEMEEQPAEVLYSGIVGPWGDAYAADRDMSADEAQDYHRVQITALADAGADLVQAMTFSSIPEAVGVARAAHEAGLPVSISFTLGTGSRLLGGQSLREAIETVDEQAGAARPDFFGVNCSHPFEFLPALDAGSWTERLRSLRPNASAKEKIELCQIGHLEEGDPVELGGQIGAIAARYPAMDVFGGCCGTWDTHLDQIARGVRSARVV